MKETEQQHPPQIIELSEFQPQPPSGPAVLGGNMRLLQGVKVKLTVVVGEAQTTLGELMDLKEASILKIDREVDYPVDVLVEGNVVARGQLVVVDDHFGVRVTEIAAPAQS
ncbi:MAG TPA: FliM/FliN family flagellar motor switch protein [Noviherbaspirillum sp.]